MAHLYLTFLFTQKLIKYREYKNIVLSKIMFNRIIIHILNELNDNAYFLLVIRLFTHILKK